MDSSYENSDVELEGSFAQTASVDAGTPGVTTGGGAVRSGSHPASDPTTIPLSRPFDGTKHSSSTEKATSVEPASTFHEPLVSLSFDGDEDEEEDDSEDDVQLDNTPADAAQARQRAATTAYAAKHWTCKECTFAENATDTDQCEMCDGSRYGTPQQSERNPRLDTNKHHQSKGHQRDACEKSAIRPPFKTTHVDPKCGAESDQEKVKEDSEDEEELSLDSDREFDMPAFKTVILPDSQPFMLTTSTLAPSVTQRLNDGKSIGKSQAVYISHSQAEEAISSDDDEKDKGLKITSQKEDQGLRRMERKAPLKADKGKEKASDEESHGLDEKTNKPQDKATGKGEAQVVPSSCDFDFPPWDDPEAKRSSNTSKKSGSTGSKATRAETNFMAYARSRKRHGSTAEEAQTKSLPNDNGKQIHKEKNSWIATAAKESRKAIPARRLAQRKNRVIQSSSDESDKEMEATRMQGEKKTKRYQAKNTKKSKRPARSAEQWQEDSDEDEAIDHDHSIGSQDGEEDDEAVQLVAHIKKGKSPSSSKSPGASDKGERKKAKRKSREIPEEDTDTKEFMWRKIEKDMIASETGGTRPKNEDQLFKGLQFLVTGLATEDDDNDERSGERIMRLISDEGGKVLNNFANASLTSQCKKRSGYPNIPSTFLISSKPRTTLKYLLSVAAGLPTIHFNWVIHCCQQRCLLPHTLYILPAGYSVEKNREVFIKKPREDVFESMRVEVVGPPDFKNMWKLVLKEGGAKVVERLFTPQEDRVECVVSPPDPEDYIRAKLKKLAKAGVPVVGKQWVIQSLLNQRMAEMTDEVYHFENY